MNRKYFLGMVLAGIVLLSIAGVLFFTQQSVTSGAPQTDAAVAMPDDDIHRGASAASGPVNDFIALGLTRAQAGDVSGAIEAFEVALAAADNATDSAMPNYYLGLVYAQGNDMDTAIDYMESAVEADPEMAVAWVALGSMRLSTGRPVTAIDAFTQALALNPDDPITLTNRGQAYMHISAFDRALDDFNRAIELNPELAAAYFNRGSYYMRQGDPAAAVDDFTSVLDLDASQAAAHFNRAMAYIDLGQTEEAINDLVIFLAFRPEETLRAQAQAVLDELRGVTPEASEDGAPPESTTDPTDERN